MKERSILFSGAMVRALLAGTKTQTRRVVKLKPHQQIEERDDGTPWPWMYDGERDADAWMACPYGQPTDRLWVRETWYCDDYRVQRGPYVKPNDMDLDEARDDGTLIYRASSGDRPYEAEQPVWRPAIHMPRWASRITLGITSVRVERLQDISEADAQAEGATPIPDHCDHVRLACADIGCSGPQPHRLGFRAIWQDINGPTSWDANPWVWVVEFERVKK